MLMQISSAGNTGENAYMQTAYRRIVIFGMALHVSYTVLFAGLQVTALLLYNTGSTVFYLCMLYLIKKGVYRAAITAIHFEVCVFVTVMALALGWNAGSALFLIATSSLVYFCPYKRAYIPYLFSALEMCLFFGVYAFTHNVTPFYTLDDGLLSFLFICSAVSCFAVIFFSSLTARVSATVDRKELLTQNEHLSVKADYDQLTGLLSRYSFSQRLENCTRGRLAFAMGDIDDFKKINDTYGHACGDYVLREISGLMQDCCKENAYICRWGGEEFLMLFNGISDREVLEQIQTMRREIEQRPFLFGDIELRVTMTFGVSFGWEKEGAEQLIEKADALMYKGKKNGKNRVVVKE